MSTIPSSPTSLPPKRTELAKTGPSTSVPQARKVKSGDVTREVREVGDMVENLSPDDEALSKKLEKLNRSIPRNEKCSSTLSKLQFASYGLGVAGGIAAAFLINPLIGAGVCAVGILAGKSCKALKNNFNKEIAVQKKQKKALHTKMRYRESVSIDAVKRQIREMRSMLKGIKREDKVLSAKYRELEKSIPRNEFGANASAVMQVAANGTGLIAGIATAISFHPLAGLGVLAAGVITGGFMGHKKNKLQKKAEQGRYKKNAIAQTLTQRKKDKQKLSGALIKANNLLKTLEKREEKKDEKRIREEFDDMLNTLEEVENSSDVIVTEDGMVIIDGLKLEMNKNAVSNQPKQ